MSTRMPVVWREYCANPQCQAALPRLQPGNPALGFQKPQFGGGRVCKSCQHKVEPDMSVYKQVPRSKSTVADQLIDLYREGESIDEAVRGDDETSKWPSMPQRKDRPKGYKPTCQRCHTKMRLNTAGDAEGTQYFDCPRCGAEGD